jgi:hypothetical protein
MMLLIWIMGMMNMTPFLVMRMRMELLQFGDDIQQSTTGGSS